MSNLSKCAFQKWDPLSVNSRHSLNRVSVAALEEILSLVRCHSVHILMQWPFFPAAALIAVTCSWNHIVSYVLAIADTVCSVHLACIYLYKMCNYPLVSIECKTGCTVLCSWKLKSLTVQTYSFLVMTLVVIKKTQWRLCVLVVQLSPILQWQKASRITNGCFKVTTNVEIYVQLAWLLLTFWNIYLRLANCWMSYFGTIFFSCLPLLLLIPSASREVDWSGADFTLHSIYTNSSAVLSSPSSLLGLL